MQFCLRASQPKQDSLNSYIYECMGLDNSQSRASLVPSSIGQLSSLQEYRLGNSFISPRDY